MRERERFRVSTREREDKTLASELISRESETASVVERGMASKKIREFVC